MSKLLEVKKLCASYGATQVLFDVDFSLETGHITAILGANGAGKTTTLRALCQVVKTSGSIELDGTQVVGKSTESVVRMGVAHVPDGRGTFTGLSVEENLRLGAYARGNKAEMLQDMERMFTRFPILKQRRHQQAGTLSGGEQQMLAISRALMLRPKLLLLDEPTEGIQPSVIKDIGRAITYLRQRGDMAIVLVEQYLDFAHELADDFAVMDRGEVVMSGTRETFDVEAVRKHMTV